MKICPQCESGYHDSHTTCPTHGGLLSEIRDLRPGMLIRDTYRIKRKLGKGGMGSVYLAQQTLMDEPRALKFLSQELSEDEAFTSRFLREVRTLRQVRNKNVVDCGDPERAEDGSLFFSMEFVDGPNLRDFLKTAPRPFDVRLALDITRGIAEGLGAAHAKGMVHRDIKPENILLAKEDERWVPKIADFGIVATKESSQQTRTGSTLLTMAYAAPEQWTGTRAAELDGRTDLYALGGVLFEMLTGQCLFDAENYHGWAQMHLNSAPAAPSSLRPELKQWRGLDALVLRLLAKDRKDRPKDVAELLAIIDAVVYDPAPASQSPDGWAPTVMYTPPAARPLPSQPHPGTVDSRQEAETSMRVPVDRPGTLASRQEAETSMRVPVDRPGTLASRQEAETSMRVPVDRPGTLASRQEAETSMRVPVQNQGTGEFKTHTANPTLASGEKRATAEFQTLSRTPRRTTTDGRTSGAYRTVGRTSRGVAVQNPAAVRDEPVGIRARRGVPVWIWIAILALLAGLGYAGRQYYMPAKVKFVTLVSQSQPILSVAFSPNGLTLASASHDNSIQLWDVSTGKALNSFPDHVDAVTYSPDGRSLATADWDRSVKQWDAASGQVLATFDGHTGKVLTVAFSPDGHTLASGSSDKTVRLWDLSSEKIQRVLEGHTADVNSVAFSPDGRTLASGSSDNTVRLWDPATGKLLRTLQGHTGPVNSVAFSPGGRTLASASDDTTVKLWDVAAGKVLRTLQGHTASVRSVAFSPDGRTLASGSDDNTVKIWDVASGKPVSTLQGQSAAILAVAFTPDGSILASGSADNSVRLWYMSTVHN